MSPLRSTTSRTHGVAIIGAGPYGLSVATHLKERGIGVRIFGSPMSFWSRMPATINLKSFAWATNVYAPRRGFGFPTYCRANGLEDLEPCSMETFAAYGLWVQRALLPEVEQTDVVEVRGAARGGFELRLETGETLAARNVVVATGLSHFARVPGPLAPMPPALATHSSVHTSLSAFAGKDVAVVGGGASALETATLVLEAGGRPVLLARDREIVFHTKFNPRRSLRERFRSPSSALGPGRKSWVLENVPLLIHHVPVKQRVRFTRNYLGPSGPWWLFDRFEGKVPVRLRTRLTGAEAHGGRLRLEVDAEGSGRETLIVDHAIAGTGFVVDVDRIPFLDAALRDRIRRVETSPDLSSYFETSVAGLFFVGATAAYSFGPLLRFVAGARVAAPRVARRIASSA
jgi:cation diffusion facilitator CzcD-associated flavoprotein CzcO